MDLQTALMIVAFVAAIIYVGRIVYRSIFPKENGCASGCGKCAANFDTIQPPKN